jgi:hypothetical protein
MHERELMANEEEANKARRQHGKKLMQQGAHAIGVEQGKAYGSKGFVIVAHVPPGKKKLNIPEKVSCATAGGEVEVPVVIEQSEPFELE